MSDRDDFAAEKAESRKQKAEGRKQRKRSLLPSGAKRTAFCLLVSAAFWREAHCLLVSAFCLLLSAFWFTVGNQAQTPARPMTLEQSIAEALRQSPQARAARFARETAQVAAERDRPVARPTVTAVVSGTLQGPRVTFPRPDGTPATVLPEQAGRVDLIVEQPLYRAGKRAAQERYAAQASTVALDYRKSLSDIALVVQKAYLEVLRAESGVRAANEGLAAAQRYQDLVKHRIDAGSAKPVDAETVASQVAEAQAGETQAQGGLELARLSFNRGLGRPLETPVSLSLDLALPTIPASPSAAVAAALQQRTEIASLEQSVRMAHAGVALAKSQSQPALSVRGQVTEQTPSAFLHEHYAAATLELRWPLLDGAKTRLDTQEARAGAQRLEALLEETRQGIALEVIQAWQKMREARARRELAQTRRRGTEATATVAEKAYEVGRGTVLEVQSAQREVRAAREQELRALYDLQTAAADFAYAQGSVPAEVETAAPLPPRSGP
jgi:outer membrane protein TolC